MMNHSHNDKIKFNSYTRLKFKDFGIKIWALTMLMLFGLQSISVKSQQYPVKLVPVVIPPYSMRLGDYATSTDNKLQLQVLMTDLMEPQHQTGIKFTLEAGLNAAPFAQSNEFVVGMNPFLLYPGSNVTLTNVDLRALFELQNLGGINAVQYSQPLSDGVYKFCFQAYDYYTKNNLSSKTCATVFLTQYDPPMLNLPQNAEKVQAMSSYAGGSGIVFQWMPRQIANNTRYIFTLKELWDAGQSPISGFLSSPALWTEETYAPTLYYGVDKTQLIPGKRYAWQVQAKSGNPVVGANPTEDNGVYKNNGLSEIFYFDYVENCTIPTLLMAKNVGRGRVELSWSLAGNPSGLYNVQYRKKGSTSEWNSEQSYQPKYIITGLEDQTEYEYRIGSVCGQVQNTSENAYSYSGIQYFTTDANDTTNNYQCGIMPAVDISNQNLLQTLLGANEVFMAGDFPVTVMSAQGSNGIYSGTGYIVVPYLADTKIKVSFNNIKLNTDKKLVEGVIETTYDPNETAVSYTSAGIGETFGDAGVKDVFVNFPIGGITYSATPPPGKITITGSDGGSGTSSTTEYPGGKDYTFTDPDGNIWTVDENGTVTGPQKMAQGGASTSSNTEGVTGSGNNATINQYTAKGIKIEWKEDSNGKFAYDTAEKNKLPKDKYPSVKDSENTTVYVPYKATVNKQTELFDAKVSITDPSLKDAKIVFKTLSIGKAIDATELNKTDTERNYQLKLPGTFDYAEEEVIAVLMPKDSISKQKIISSFRLVHLSPKTVNVSLVPLDANSQSKLQSQSDKLIDIYKKIGITFNVTKDTVLDISSVVNGDTINSEDADLMSTYSPQQQQINALYKGSDARYVLFVTDKKSSTGQKGYMRLNGQFGYVYNNAQDKTGAHELGHGIFKLEHPWKTYGTTQSATPLLMDYSTGEELSHLDWKQINDPAFKLYAFQSQSDGELSDRIFKDANGKYFKSGDKISIGACLGEADVQMANKLPRGTVYTLYIPSEQKIYFAVKEGNSYVYKQRVNGAYTGDAYSLDYITTSLTEEQKKNAFEIFYPEANKQRAVNVYTGEENTEIVSGGCGNPDVNVAYQIITQDTDQTLIEFYEDLKATYNKAKAFYQNCSNQQWKPGKEPGVVPKCFWENTTTTDYYDLTDIAFMSGVIDGGYAELDGIVEMVNLITSGKIEEKINDLAYAYTLAYLECKDTSLELKKQEYGELITKLSHAQQDTGIWSWVKEKYYEPKVENLGEKIKTCDDAIQLRSDISDALTELKEAVDSWEEIKTLTKNIKDKIVGYYNLVTSQENPGRYEAGRLVIPVASTVVPVVGQAGKISKVSKTKKILKGIEELSETKTDDLVEKLVAKGEDVGIVSKLEMPSNFFENVNDLASTYDQYGKLSRTLRGEIYNYYKQQKWDKLEQILKENKLNGGWPPANGGYNIVDDVVLTKGMKFDRYQEWFKLNENGKPTFGGSFTSPIYETPYSYGQRALKVAEKDNPLFYEIEILKDLPIKGQQADVIPWFNQVGGGKQMMFKFPKTGEITNFQQLIDKGYIKITIKNSPNGLFNNWVGVSF